METYYSRNRDRVLARMKKHREEHRELYSIRSKKYYEKNRDVIAQKVVERKNKDIELFHSNQARTQKRYRENHPDLVLQKRKEYEENNHPRILEMKRVRREQKEVKEKAQIYAKKYNSRPEIVERRRKRYLDDINFRLAMNLRGRISQALREKRKAGSAVRDLGCTLDELKVYLENKFKEGMSWENRGQFGWHIDHRLPLSQFDLTDREQFLRACHYTNLQPMWWIDNIKKGIKII